MSNITTIIQRNNIKTINDYNNNNNFEIKLCTCRMKNTYPLNNKCLLKNVVYKATIKTLNELKHYLAPPVKHSNAYGMTMLVISKLAIATALNSQNTLEDEK